MKLNPVLVSAICGALCVIVTYSSLRWGKFAAPDPAALLSKARAELAQQEAEATARHQATSESMARKQTEIEASHARVEGALEKDHNTVRMLTEEYALLGAARTTLNAADTSAVAAFEARSAKYNEARRILLNKYSGRLTLQDATRLHELSKQFGIKE